MARATNWLHAARLTLCWGWVLLTAGCGWGYDRGVLTKVRGTSEYSARQLVSSGPRGMGPVGDRGEWTLGGGFQAAEVGASRDNGASMYTNTATAEVRHALHDRVELGAAARIPLPGTQRANHDAAHAVRGTPSTEVAIFARASTKKLGLFQGVMGLHVAAATALYNRLVQATGVEENDPCADSYELTCSEPKQTKNYDITATAGDRVATTQLGAQLSVLVEALPRLYVEVGTVYQRAPAWWHKRTIDTGCPTSGPTCLQHVADAQENGMTVEHQILPFLAVAWRTGMVSVTGHVYTTAWSERIVLPVAGGTGLQVHF